MAEDKPIIKRKCLSLKEKMDIISELRTNQRPLVAKKYGIPKSTVSKIWKEREIIETLFLSKNGNLKRDRACKFGDIEDALVEWYRLQRSQNIPVSGPILMEKAMEFAETFGVNNFKGSPGWLDKWKRRHNISFRTVKDEAGLEVEQLTFEGPKTCLICNKQFDRKPKISEVNSLEWRKVLRLFWGILKEGKKDFNLDFGKSDSENEEGPWCGVCSLALADLIRLEKIIVETKAQQRTVLEQLKEVIISSLQAEDDQSSPTCLSYELRSIRAGLINVIRSSTTGSTATETNEFGEWDSNDELIIPWSPDIRMEEEEEVEMKHVPDVIISEEEVNSTNSPAGINEEGVSESEHEGKSISKTRIKSKRKRQRQPKPEAGPDLDHNEEQADPDINSKLDNNDSDYEQERKRRKVKKLSLRQRTDKISISAKKKNRKIWTCSLCSFSTKDIPFYEEHLRGQHETSDKPLKCDQCLQTYTCEDYMNLHKLRHKGEYKTKCYVCEKFVNAIELPGHMKGHADDVVIIDCEHCSNKFTSLEQLMNHAYRSHKTPVNGLKCPLCQEVFKTAGNLLQHLKVEHHAVKEYVCDFEGCGKVLVTQGSLDVHKNLHTGKFRCKECWKSFSTRQALEDHYSVHTGAKKWNCDQCPEAFKQKETLYVHQIKAHGAPKPKCDLCSKEFLSRDGVKEHMIREHDAKGAKLCPICGKKFPRSNALKKHLEGHSSTKNYVCDVCGKSFNTIRGLKEHGKVHEEKKFSCSFCGKLFTFSKNLTDHVRIHTGERPHVCDFCGKAFNQKTPHTLHVKKCNLNPGRIF